ncbi:MAG: transglycosylase SLT domain-containing protein, partial [Burkholderiales bacterium]
MIKIAARYTLISFVVFAAACAQLPGEMAATEGASGLQPQTQDPIVIIAAQAGPVSPVAAAAVVTEPQVKAPPKDVWERVRNGYTMKPMDTDLVRHWENFYSAKPDYFARMVDRSSHYLFHIIEEIERRKMPAEVALLPMIESAYNPQAYSKAHASGLWQFIPSTGRLYGLRQNWWYDGRRDVIAATNAALDYLEKLYGMFGDWELALASYNWGEGAVSRAIARNQAKGLPTDYASLTMPAETRNYLPKLIAVKNIIADPARFGVKLASIPNEPYFEVISVKRHIDIKLAARFADMTLDEFRFLNPAHNKPVIKSDGSETIVLPRNRISLFRANIENSDKPLVSWQAHTVKAGEKPEKIAANYGMSVNELK